MPIDGKDLGNALYNFDDLKQLDTVEHQVNDDDGDPVVKAQVIIKVREGFNWKSIPLKRLTRFMQVLGRKVMNPIVAFIKNQQNGENDDN